MMTEPARHLRDDFSGVGGFWVAEEVLGRAGFSIASRHQPWGPVVRREIINGPKRIARLGAVYGSSFEFPVTVQWLSRHREAPLVDCGN